MLSIFENNLRTKYGESLQFQGRKYSMREIILYPGTMFKILVFKILDRTYLFQSSFLECRAQSTDEPACSLNSLKS